MGIRAFAILALGLMFLPQSVASSTRVQSDIPSLYQTLAGYFPIGAAIWSGDLRTTRRASCETLQQHRGRKRDENGVSGTHRRCI